MDIVSIILLAIGLAMDCFAVAFSKGMADKGKTFPLGALLMAFCFGLYQGVMPLIGYFAGVNFASFFERWSNWIALVLLCLIGGKMLVEGIRTKKQPMPPTDTDKPLFSFWQTQLLAVATSIDALATGVLFIPVPEVLWLAVAVIGVVSFVFALSGFQFGKYFGLRFRFNTDIMGGLILILIGVKIFIEGL